MTSVQCARNEETKLNNEEEATLNELMKLATNQITENTRKEALALIPAQNNNPRNIVSVIAGCLKNQTKSQLNLLADKTWSGYFVSKYNQVIDDYTLFVQGGLFACKTAVVYWAKNRAGTPCGWLVAWSESAMDGYKVYVECGLKDIYDCINWRRIEKKLDEGSWSSNYSDPYTDTVVYAALLGADDTSALTAVFSG